MSVYSTNQNRQLYVAAGVADTLDGIQGKSNLGKVCIKTDADGCKFINQNGNGGIVRSDLINPDTIMWANASAPEDSSIKLKAYSLELDSTINSGAPIPGQDYIVRINFRQLYGMSDEDIYQKYGAVHVTAKSNTLPKFLKEMAFSLIKNFNRLYSPLVYVGLATATKFALIKSAVKDNNGDITFTYYPAADFAGASAYSNDTATDLASPTKLIIAEMSQVNEWALGTKKYTPVYFEIVPTTVNDTTYGEVEWGKVDDFSATYNQSVGNGYKYADLEYFCMGERGDQYRNIGWPNVIPTKYFVDPTKEYFSLDIHYAYQGTCEDIQKSEKTLTILATGSDRATAMGIINSIIEKMGIGDMVSYTDMFNDGIKDNDGVRAKTVTERIAGKADKTNNG